jgi:hypothetical protein
MKTIRLFSYIKNQERLLCQWLDHHLSIVPGWAIHIVDNNSTDSTPDILTRYKKNHGINTHTHDHFPWKGQKITELILRYKNHPGLSIPLDGDEFLVLMTGDRYKSHVVSSGEKIQSYLKGLSLKFGCYRTLGCLNSIPEQEYYDDPISEITKFNWHWNDQTMCKKFYSTEKFIKTDQGNHHNGCKRLPTYNTDIAYLHYHDIGREDMETRCKLICEGHGLGTLEQLQMRAGEDNKSQLDHGFVGVERANEYLNLQNRQYTVVNSWDIQFNWNN